MSDTQALKEKVLKALPAPSKRPHIEKAAAVLALLDEKSLQALSGRVSDKHRDKLISTVKSMRSVPQPELRQIAKEFAQRMNLEKDAVRGSDEIAKRLTGALFADEQDDMLKPQSAELDEMLAQLNQTPFWERVGHLSAKKLIGYFEDKSASVLSIAMQMLPAEIASRLAAELEPDIIREAMLLMATMGTPNPLAVQAVERMVDEALLSGKDEDVAADDDENPNAKVVAGILNRLTNKRREMVLEALKENLKGDDMGQIASQVLSFEALEYRLPRNAIPVLFREVAEKEILMALQSAMSQNNPVAEYLLGNISQRLAATYREQIEKMPDIEEEAGEMAQSAVICKLLEIVEQGRIDLLDPKEDE